MEGVLLLEGRELSFVGLLDGDGAVGSLEGGCSGDCDCGGKASADIVVLGVEDVVGGEVAVSVTTTSAMPSSSAYAVQGKTAAAPVI